MYYFVVVIIIIMTSLSCRVVLTALALRQDFDGVFLQALYYQQQEGKEEEGGVLVYYGWYTNHPHKVGVYLHRRRPSAIPMLWKHCRKDPSVECCCIIPLASPYHALLGLPVFMVSCRYVSLSAVEVVMVEVLALVPVASACSFPLVLHHNSLSPSL